MFHCINKFWLIRKKVANSEKLEYDKNLKKILVNPEKISLIRKKLAKIRKKTLLIRKNVANQEKTLRILKKRR